MTTGNEEAEAFPTVHVSDEDEAPDLSWNYESGAPIQFDREKARNILAGYEDHSFVSGSEVLPCEPDFKRSKVTIRDTDAGDGAPLSSASSSSTPIAMPAHLVTEAVRLMDTKQFKYPWERGPLARFFRDDTLDRFPQLRIQPRPGGLVQVNLDVDANREASASMSVELPTVGGTIFTGVVKSMVGTSYVEERQERRVSAIKQWAEMLMHDLSASDVGVTSKLECQDGRLFEYVTLQLDAIFALKSPNTLLKRLYSIKMFHGWMMTTFGRPWLPFNELEVWTYLNELRRSSAAATRATSLLEAIRFSFFILQVTGAKEVLESRRVKGIAAQMFASKRPWKPADAFTTAQVVALHKAFEDTANNLTDRVILGHILHLLYSRSRFADLLAVEHLMLDDEKMYFELEATYHKGARSADSRAKLLPIVAPAIGIWGKNWAELYLQLRAEAGLINPTTEPIPMLPAPAKDCTGSWTDRYLTSSELNGFIKCFFKSQGMLREGDKITSHSCKATAISWAAKFGIDPDTRAVLARHAVATKTPTALYSRDLISAAVRKFSEVIDQIRGQFFWPDRTRGGMLTPPPGTPAFSQKGWSTIQPQRERTPDHLEAERNPGTQEETEHEENASEFCLSPATPVQSPPNEVVKQEDVFPTQDLPTEVIVISDEVDLLRDWEGNGSSESEWDSESEDSSSDVDDEAEKIREAFAVMERPAPSAKYFINCRSLVLHCLKDANRFVCGRIRSDSYAAVAELNGLRCGRCFN